ncbi:type II toxin-antitoxin system RelE/ParE family toxin [Pseudopedobacter beijingensis]|uniref:Type II toxin-antitoxin system RelE/ParE family toxin n=1 Tax=Pseudopedobacter beijingensis TaxID=1207056 RepID=A0ABW4IDB6_9SPHI
MKNGYKILWTENALKELALTIKYLEQNFTEKEIKKLAQKIENVVKLISQNPKLFPKSDKKNIYRLVILKYNTLYYRVNETDIEILSFFSNRQNPKKKKL